MPFRDAVIDPPGKMALLLTQVGSLHRYSYPDFKLEAYYPVDRNPLRITVDRKRDRVYVLRSERVHTLRDGATRGEEAELLAFDRKEVKPVLKKKGTSLTPASRLKLDTTVGRMRLRRTGVISTMRIRKSTRSAGSIWRSGSSPARSSWRRA